MPSEPEPRAPQEALLNAPDAKFGVTSFTTMFGPPVFRVYQVSSDPGNNRWLLQLIGDDAEVKAKAIALILNGSL